MFVFAWYWFAAVVDCSRQTGMSHDCPAVTEHDVVVQASSVVVKSDSDSGVGTGPHSDPAAGTAEDLQTEQEKAIKNRVVPLTAWEQSEQRHIPDPVPGSSNHRRRVRSKTAQPATFSIPRLPALLHHRQVLCWSSTDSSWIICCSQSVWI